MANTVSCINSWLNAACRELQGGVGARLEEGLEGLAVPKAEAAPAADEEEHVDAVRRVDPELPEPGCILLNSQ